MLIDRWVIDRDIRWFFALTIVAATLSMTFPSFAGREGPERELTVIKALGGRAVREGDSLRLKLSDGTERVYKNENQCDGEGSSIHHCFSFRLHGYFEKNNMYVISVQYWEGNEYLYLMGDTGIDEFIGGFPVFSPSSEQFITINYGLGYADSISIWRKSGDKFRQIWNRKYGCPNGNGGFFNVEMDFWLSESEIVVTDSLLKNDLEKRSVNNELNKYYKKLESETGYRLNPKLSIDVDGDYSGFLELPVILVNQPIGSDRWDFAALPETCR